MVHNDGGRKSGGSFAELDHQNDDRRENPVCVVRRASKDRGGDGKKIEREWE